MESKTCIPPKSSIHNHTHVNPSTDARLIGVQFGLCSIKEAAHLSVIREKNAKECFSTWQDLFDPRLGIPNKDQKCATCSGSRRGGCDRQSSCDGHFGHIPLPVPIYHPYYVRKCQKILQSICLSCCRVLEKKKRRNVLDAVFQDTSTPDENGKGLSSSGRKRKNGATDCDVSCRKKKQMGKGRDIHGIAEFFIQGGFDSHPALKQEPVNSCHLDFPDPLLPQLQKCKQEPREIERSSLGSMDREMPANPGQPHICQHCGGPDRDGASKFPKVKLKVVGKQVGRKGRIETIKLVVDEKADRLPNGFWDFVKGHPTDNNDRTRTLLPSEALTILRKIPNDEIAKLHMDKVVSRPEAFIMKALLVTPNCNRLIMEDWNSTAQPKVLMRRGRQNSKLEAVVKKVKQINEASSDVDFADAEQNSEDLQLLVARHFRACKVVEFRMKTGQETEETGGSLELKWLKANVLAKRSNFSARTVINGDPYIRIEEIGIPTEVALRLTVEENINSLNMRRWQKLINDYMQAGKAMTGALLLKKSKSMQPRDLEVLRGNMKGKHLKDLDFKVELGDTVIRCLQDGDFVFANRPPSLHKHSLIALKVKIHQLSTFAINPLICPPFDADFDGDAFHIFVPQSLEGMAELQELMSVTQQMICPQGGQTLVGLTQDSLVGGHLLMKSDVFINQKDMNQLSMWCSSEMAMPLPAIMKSPSNVGPLWTGKQLFSMTLPDGLDFGNLYWTGKLPDITVPPATNSSPDGEVLVRNGEILLCQGSSKWLERSPSGIIRAVCNHAGPVAAVDHLNCLQGVLHQWLLLRGFSVGLLDYHAAADANSRKRMLDGVQMSLERLDEASLIQTLMLDRQVQFRILSPQCNGVADIDHQGSFGLLLDGRSSRQRITSLQGAAVEKFQSLLPVIENLVTGYMGKHNSLLTMVESGSKGSKFKITQQVGCLGLQLYKGETILPLNSCSKLTYFLSSPGSGKSEVFCKSKDTSVVGYWESRGIISSSYFDGLNPPEFFVDAIASRCNVMRQGVEEPNQILKCLMLFMRDTHIAYDGTVRNRNGQRVIQFQYGGVRTCLNDTDSCFRVSRGSSSDLPNIKNSPTEYWADSKLAGEPVGVLAATAIAEPAYNVKMQSIHQTHLLGSGPVQLLKETLLAGSKTKLKFNDRRSILRLHQGFGIERRALEIQNELQKIPLEMITLTSAIEFRPLDGKFYLHRQSGRLINRFSPWMGHLRLCKKTVEVNNLDISSIVELLNTKHSRRAIGDAHDIYFSYSDNCQSKVHTQSRGLCIWFFPLLPLENVAEEFSRQKMGLLLELMKTIILPAVLKTTVKGSDDIESVRIIWEDSGSASRLPCGSSLLSQSSIYQGKLSDPGELALEVVVRAPRGTGKRGVPWNTVKEACIPVMDLIDWRRSAPYSIQEINQNYGVEAAQQNIMKRLMLATKTMGKPVLEEHLMLVADTMTHCGEVLGLGPAGYRDFCRNLSISTPFTEAAFKEPKKVFLDAAAKGAFDSINGVLPSAVWGTRVPVGTGIEFTLKAQVPRAKGQTWPVDPLVLWDELQVRMATLGKRESSFCVNQDSLFKQRMQQASVCQPSIQNEGFKSSSTETGADLELKILNNKKAKSNYIPTHARAGNKHTVSTVAGKIGKCETTSPWATEGVTMVQNLTGCEGVAIIGELNRRKRSLDMVEDGCKVSNERASKIHNQLVDFGSPRMEGDPAFLRVSDLHRLTGLTTDCDAVIEESMDTPLWKNKDLLSGLTQLSPRVDLDDGLKVDCTFSRLVDNSKDSLLWMDKDQLCGLTQPSRRVDQPNRWKVDCTGSVVVEDPRNALRWKSDQCVLHRVSLSPEVGHQNEPLTSMPVRVGHQGGPTMSLPLEIPPSNRKTLSLPVKASCQNRSPSLPVEGGHWNESATSLGQSISLDSIHSRRKKINDEISPSPIFSRLASPVDNHKANAAATPVILEISSGGNSKTAEETPSANSRRSGGVWSNMVSTLFSFLNPSSRNAEDRSLEIEVSNDTWMRNGHSEKGRDGSSFGILQDDPVQQNAPSTCVNVINGQIRSDTFDKEVEQGIIDTSKELQNLLHVRYRPGERVQGDTEKMLLEDVLVHHPKRAEKVGCGVDYVKVDYHPDHPKSKCFHIVRKDGSSSDFSYHKCLDSKFLKLCNRRQN